MKVAWVKFGRKSKLHIWSLRVKLTSLDRFILKQLERVPRIFQCAIPRQENYLTIRKIFLDDVSSNSKKAMIDFRINILCHFTFCKGMHSFSTQFYKLWDDCFSDTAICNMKPIVGSKRLDNLRDYLVMKKPHRSLLKINGQLQQN